MADLDVDIGWDEKGLDAALAQVERELSAAARGVAVQTWDRLLRGTPQYWGRMAASWQFSIGTPVAVNRAPLVERSLFGTADGQNRFSEFGTGVDAESGELVSPFYAGHPWAVGIAQAANAGNELKFKLGDIVWFTNAADHGEGEYAGTVEEYGPDRLRPVNHPAHNVLVTALWFGSKFGAVISSGRAKRLAEARIGGRQ